MIRDLLAYEFSNRSKFMHLFIYCFTEGETTKVSNSESQMLKSLISRAGDVIKNNDRLKFALVSIRYPEAYDEI
jgi:hypothetical protein